MRVQIVITICCLLHVGSVGAACANPYDDSVPLELGQKLERAANEIADVTSLNDRAFDAALDGDRDAQFKIAESYFRGLRHLPVDIQTAAEWLILSARPTHTQETFLLARPDPDAHVSEAGEYFRSGYAYHTGTGVAQNAITARRKYLKAAKLGHAAAANNLGVIYFAGQGVPVSHNTAGEWFSKAAQGNNPLGMYHTGLLHLHGLGLEQDGQKALAYFHEAARHNVGEAQAKLGLLHFYGTVVQKDDGAAASWFQKAAINNVPLAMRHLGYMYQAGRGVRPGAVAAMRYYGASAFERRAEIYYWLGLMNRGWGNGNEDYAKSYIWMSLAREYGDIEMKQDVREWILTAEDHMDTHEKRSARDQLDDLRRRIDLYQDNPHRIKSRL